MINSSSRPTLRSAKRYIDKLNFEWVVKKLSKPDPNIARVWKKKEIQEAIEQYKKYLYLRRVHIDSAVLLPPSFEVDEIWHHHILDTRKYFKDCENIFGFYFHHFPYFGMRSKNDFKNLQKAFKITQKEYFKQFDEYLYAVWDT